MMSSRKFLCSKFFSSYLALIVCVIVLFAVFMPTESGKLLKLKKLKKILPYLLAMKPSKKILFPLPLPLVLPIPILKLTKQIELPKIPMPTMNSWPQMDSWGGGMADTSGGGSGWR